MMESPLEVLSRAATMVQDNANDAHLATKELPTAKWRRDRNRLRAAEYHPYSLNLSSSSSSPLSSAASSITSQSPPSSPLAAGAATTGTSNSEIPVGGYHHHHSSNVRPLSETTTNTNNSSECYPIDMTVTSSTASKPRSPPPPYREPLPGSTFVTSLPRPSVITQAPPKCSITGRRLSSSSTTSSTSPLSMISNRENDHFSTTSTATESISMCDPVIDEHFRRSLGADYMALFGKKTPQPSPQNMTAKAKSPLSPRRTVTPTNSTSNTSNSNHHDSSNNSNSKDTVDSKEISSSSPKRITLLNSSDSVGNSVDDHFAKALGDTWKKLQEKKEINNDKAGEREKDNQK